MEKWKIDKKQKRLLDSLFKEIDSKEIKSILDVGGGRTSVSYLTNRFKDKKIKSIVYPGDERKIKPILESVASNNYQIIESDIRDFKSKKVDLILSHLFLGEAEKFNKNKFETILKALFGLKTKYLVIVNREDDGVNYFSFFKLLPAKSKIVKVFCLKQESNNNHEYLGMVIKM